MNGLDRYGAEPFEQQQFGAAGVEGVKQADEWRGFCWYEMCKIHRLIWLN